ncbi:MAG TPA: tetratricopeptide repeat protein [Drouetiella sp.]|jgi:tetratricopeptide (TPR) repeat protein
MNRIVAQSGVLSSTLKEEAQLARKIKIAFRENGPEHVDAALALLELGDFYFAEERFVDSAESFKRALDIYESLGEGHQLLVALAMRSLSAALVQQGKYVEGAAMSKSARSLMQQYQ